MANHEIPQEPIFSEELRKLETTDPGHANTFNPLFEILIKNDVHLKRLAEGLVAGTVENPNLNTENKNYTGAINEILDIQSANADAISTLGDIVTSHQADDVKHVTQTEKDAWNAKEPAITKKTGFNLDKSDSVTSTSTTTLATSLAVKTAMDKANEAFQSASNGKTEIATAITGMGQSASSSDSFTILSNKIKNISTDATAATAQVLSGKTFYQGGVKRTGTMPNRGTINITPSTSNQTIPSGYHSGAGVVYGDPDLIASNIRSGKNIFGVAGTLLEGACIKGVQTGEYAVGLETSYNVSITPVNLSKSVLLTYGISLNSYSAFGASMQCVQGVLTSNAIQFSRFETGNSGIRVRWYVIEFEGNINVQRGVALGSQKPTISSVNTNKSFILINLKSYGDAFDIRVAPVFNSGSQIAFNYADDNPSIAWQVITFL